MSSLTELKAKTNEGAGLPVGHRTALDTVLRLQRAIDHPKDVLEGGKNGLGATRAAGSALMFCL